MILRVGCAGFALPQSEYVARFPLVEVQQTFYQPPRPATAARWRALAPAGFVFSIKAWQLITHEVSSPTYRRLTRPIPEAARDRYGGFRPTAEVQEAWQATRAICDAVAAPIVLFQTPPAFTPTATHRARLERFFGEVDRGGRRFVWEPRGLWEAPDVESLCRKLGLVHGVDPLQQRTTTPGLAYYRLHGSGAAAGSYGELELEKIFLACEGFDEVYVVFNNLGMAKDAGRFGALVRALGDA